MAELLHRRPSGEWEDDLHRRRRPGRQGQHLKEAFAHPQVVARARSSGRIEDGSGRTAHVAADPMGINPASRPPVALRTSRGRLGRAAGPAIRRPSATPQREMPLDGTRVIEMDGNEPSKTLAHADPRRPRRRRAPDRAARAGPAARRQRRRRTTSCSPTPCAGECTGASGPITLNLKEERDRSAYHELVAGADVVYDNYRPGVKARLGRLARRPGCGSSPAIVTCSATGFGATGPWAQAPAYDVTLQALGGCDEHHRQRRRGRSADPVGPSRSGGLAGGLYGADRRARLAPRRAARPALAARRPLAARHPDRAALLPRPAGARPRRSSSSPSRAPAAAAPGRTAIYATGDGRWFAAGITDQFWRGSARRWAGPSSPTIPTSPPARRGRGTPPGWRRSSRRPSARGPPRSGRRSFLEHRLPGQPRAHARGGLPSSAGRAARDAEGGPHVTARPVHVSGFPIRFSRSATGHWTAPPGW